MNPTSDATRPTTAVLPPTGTFRHLSHDKAVAHWFHQGQPDARVVLSMEPGRYEFTQDEFGSGGFSTLRVLSGALQVGEGSGRHELNEAESTDVSGQPRLTVSADRFTQAELTNVPPARTPGSRPIVTAMMRPPGTPPPM